MTISLHPCATSFKNARENYTARNVARELTPAEDKALQERLKADFLARDRERRQA